MKEKKKKKKKKKKSSKKAAPETQISSSTAAEADLRSQLGILKVRELRQHALSAGISESSIEELSGIENEKGALITLLVQREREAEAARKRLEQEEIARKRLEEEAMEAAAEEQRSVDLTASIEALATVTSSRVEAQRAEEASLLVLSEADRSMRDNMGYGDASHPFERSGPELVLHIVAVRGMGTRYLEEWLRQWPGHIDTKDKVSNAAQLCVLPFWTLHRLARMPMLSLLHEP